jgi:ribosomal protein L29
MAITKKTTRINKKAMEVKSLDQLKKDLLTKQNDLVDARRGHRLGELTNPRVITLTKKEIARLNTAIRLTEIIDKKEVKL